MRPPVVPATHYRPHGGRGSLNLVVKTADPGWRLPTGPANTANARAAHAYHRAGRPCALGRNGPGGSGTRRRRRLRHRPAVLATGGDPELLGHVPMESTIGRLVANRADSPAGETDLLELTAFTSLVQRARDGDAEAFRENRNRERVVRERLALRSERTRITRAAVREGPTRGSELLGPGRYGGEGYPLRASPSELSRSGAAGLLC